MLLPSLYLFLLSPRAAWFRGPAAALQSLPDTQPKALQPGLRVNGATPRAPGRFQFASFRFSLINPHVFGSSPDASSC